MLDPHLIESLVKIIELKDLSTGAHTWRVALYARAMAEAFGLGHDVIERVTRAAALHDLGKIDVPGAILRKPGPLTPAERARMQQHPVLGYDRLIEMGEDDPIVLQLVRHHHERVDGTGYPDRLAGEQIPPVARQFAVIDAFDAMTSVRPYRTQVGEAAAERAVAELERGAGTAYDPVAVQRFVGMYRSGALSWILHYANDELMPEPLEVLPPVVVVPTKHGAVRA